MSIRMAGMKEVGSKARTKCPILKSLPSKTARQMNMADYINRYVVNINKKKCIHTTHHSERKHHSPVTQRELRYS